MDIKRTVLLVVFSLSLLMLWENWNRYNGNPSMFAEPPQATQPAPAADAAKGDASLPQSSVPQAPVASGADVPAGAPAAPALAGGALACGTEASPLAAGAAWVAGCGWSANIEGLPLYRFQFSHNISRDSENTTSKTVRLISMVFESTVNQ